MDAINGADTTWILVSSALVMLMTPALGFFYGGLVRQKNALSTIMHSFFMLAFVSILWAVIGYSLAFGPSLGGFIGSLAWVGLNGVGLEPNTDYAGTIPHQAFMIYQMMFAVITPALISGAFAERKRFKAFIIFSGLWLLLVYAPVAHWVWAVGGWIRGMGALDFAGGTVVHINAGVAGLICAIVLGKRVGYGRDPITPHNLTFMLTGVGLLLFGWYGFNAGSSLESNGLTALIILNTTVAASAAALAWTAGEWMFRGHPSLLGGASGMIAGLVAITPACGFVGPGGAIIIGLVAGFLCLWAVVVLKSKFGYDDSLDVFGVHGVGGILGALLTGVFVNPALGGSGVTDYLAADTSVAVAAYSFGTQMYAQAMAVVIAVVWTSVVTFVALMICKAVFGLRVKEQEEREGLDLVDHGERAYN